MSFARNPALSGFGDGGRSEPAATCVISRRYDPDVTSTDALAAQQRAPSAAQLRSFALLSILYAAITAAMMPWASEPGPADARIVVLYGIGILVADLCTAALLGALYRSNGRPALLVLTCAYLFGGLMSGAHMATFPGALATQPLIDGEQTVAWLFLAWRLGMAGLFLAAVLQAGSPAPAQPARRPGVALFVVCAITVVAAALVVAAAVRLQIDAIIVGERFTDLAAAVQWVAVALCAAAYAIIWRKRAFDDVLYVWLGLVLLASIADLALSNVSGGRYTVGWHASRANFFISACLLLAFLLGDLAYEDRRMARASAVAAYGGAVAVTLAALFLRWFLDPWLGNEVPYITLYGVVAIAVWFGGLGPAVLAMVLGYAIVNVRYISTTGSVSVTGPSESIALGLFTLSCALIIVLGEAMRRTRDRYRASEAEVKERARELQRADANKSRFLAVLSHELRNPLAPLRTGLALLRMREQGDAATAETHDMMERQIAQLSRLIDDLLDVSRIDRGKLELRTQRLMINTVLQTAVDTAKPNVDAQGHQLDVRYPLQPLYVEGDLVRLAQVVSNLLNNAAKFTPPKGRIELSARAENGRVLVRVADNGIGIAPERLPEVFDMFVQLEPGSMAAAGLGLGLTLARSIVRRHGGDIEARSPGRGKGSEFIIRLPLAPAPPAVELESPAPAPPPSRRRVLVVDDNVDAAQTLAAYLRLEGHRVESALDGEAALRIAEVLHPDVAFIDLNMPKMDGAEVARRLRITPWGRNAQLIALTGMGQPSDIDRTREAGFDEHITKPADLKDVSRLAAGAEKERALSS
jgi:signal transduction histidine kinase/CheY-like chemotaxis protein